ncbi:rhamnulokinase family protein [Desulfosporosinus sp. SB140]|uniref:rhamnulokinase n=1 Tax=Desulfosporosinus paludis TaxID=3115649 RepID=UPI00388F1255
MKTKNHIAVDIGASSGRLVLGTLTNEKINLMEIYRFENKIIEQNGNCFWDIEKILSEILIGLKVAKELGVLECTLGIDTWAVDYALVARDGSLVSEVYAYRDGRTKNAIKDFQNLKALTEVYKTTGIQILNFNTLFQLYVHDKEQLHKTSKILLIPDYLNYCLSGKMISEKTNASTTQLLNIQTKDYDEDLLRIIGVRREQFASLREPGEMVGPIRETLRKQYDLPQCELVCVASHDTASAILGVPGVDEQFAYLSSGTWSLIGVENTFPIISELSQANNYTNEWGAYGTYRFLKNIMGLWLIQEVRRCLGHQPSFAALAAEAETIEPFKFLIDCNAERFLKPANMILEIQQYCRETGQVIPETGGTCPLHIRQSCFDVP